MDFNGLSLSYGMVCHRAAPIPCWTHVRESQHHVFESSQSLQDSIRTFAYRRYLQNIEKLHLVDNQIVYSTRSDASENSQEKIVIPATSRIGGLSACNSICRATYCPSKWAYHKPRLPIFIIKKEKELLVKSPIQSRSISVIPIYHYSIHLNHCLIHSFRFHFDWRSHAKMEYGNNDASRKWFLVWVERVMVNEPLLP